MKKLIKAALFLTALTAFAAPTPFKVPNDTIQFGQSGSVANKCTIHDFGLGASNPAACVDNSTKSLAYNYNIFKLGDGTTVGDKKIIANNGTANLPFIFYSATNNDWEFSNDGTTSNPFGSGSGGGGGTGVDFLNLENTLEQNNNVNILPMDIALREAFVPVEPTNFYWLLQSATASGTSIYAILNPIFVSNTDKIFDSTTGWSAVLDATTLSTSATHQVGSFSLSFNKGGTATEALIQNTPSGGMNLGADQYAWYWINLPSLTNLTGAELRLCSDTGSTNCAAFVSSLNFAGGALTTGWNLIKVDVSGTPTTSTGSGWVITQAAATVSVGLKATSGQTYTGILVDGLAFSPKNESAIAQVGDGYTLYDATNAERIIIASSNTSVQGLLTLATGLVNNYTATTGTVGARSPAVSGNGNATFDSTLSGAISLTTSVRRKSIFRGTQTGATFNVNVLENAPLIFPVFSVDSTVQIKVTDNDDFHLQFMSGDQYWVFQTIPGNNGNVTYAYRNLKVTLDTNSSNSGGLTTLHNSGSNSGIQVGDTIIKADLNTYLSLVASGSNESFGSALSETDLQLLNVGVQYPYLSNQFANWSLSGNGGTKNQLKTSPGADLSTTGSLSTNVTFAKGKFGTTGFSSGNYISLSQSNSQGISCGVSDNPTALAFSVWFNAISFTGAERDLISRFNGSTGYLLYLNAGSNTIGFQFNGTQITPVAFSPNTWVNVVVEMRGTGGGSVNTSVWVNGVKTTASGSCTDDGGNFFVGTREGSGSFATSVTLADIDFIRNASAIVQTQVDTIYNGGHPNPFGVATTLNHIYQPTSLTGQKMTVQTDLIRRSSAVLPEVTGISIHK